MSLANLQEQREAVRARLLADEKVQSRIAFRAYEIYQRHGDGHGGALNNWLQAEEEVVSTLIEREFQFASASTGRKRLKGSLEGGTPKPQVKAGKKAQSREASVSDTASRRNAKTKQAAAASAKGTTSEISIAGAAKKPSDAITKRKGRSRSESQSV